MKRAIALLLGSLPGTLSMMLPIKVHKYTLQLTFGLQLAFICPSTFPGNTWEPSSSCQVSGGWETLEIRRQTHIIGVLTCPSPSSLSDSFFQPGWSDSLSLWLLHNTAQTPRLLWSSGKKKHQGLPLSFLHSFFSLFSKQRINQLYTHTYIHTTHFFSLPSVYSAASDHLDLTCIVKNWAALPLSSSLSFTPFLFQLSVINVQVLQYTNRGEEESEEWGMNWWMGG